MAYKKNSEGDGVLIAALIISLIVCGVLVGYAFTEYQKSMRTNVSDLKRLRQYVITPRRIRRSGKTKLVCEFSRNITIPEILERLSDLTGDPSLFVLTEGLNQKGIPPSTWLSHNGIVPKYEVHIPEDPGSTIYVDNVGEFHGCVVLERHLSDEDRKLANLTTSNTYGNFGVYDKVWCSNPKIGTEALFRTILLTDKPPARIVRTSPPEPLIHFQDAFSSNIQRPIEVFPTSLKEPAVPSGSLPL